MFIIHNMAKYNDYTVLRITGNNLLNINVISFSTFRWQNAGVVDDDDDDDGDDLDDKQKIKR